MMLKTFVVACLAVAVLASGAVAQTTPPAPSPNQGVFDQLSRGNQKIAQALFDAQQTTTTTKPLSRDDIAAMKRDGKGWGEVFKEMKQQGLVDAKNLGQVVSQKSGKTGLTDRKDIAADRRDLREDQRDLHQDRQVRKASSGTLITTGSGRTFVAGAQVKSGHTGAGQNGNGLQSQGTSASGSLSSGADAGHSNGGGYGARHGKN